MKVGTIAFSASGGGGGYRYGGQGAYGAGGGSNFPPTTKTAIVSSSVQGYNNIGNGQLVVSYVCPTGEYFTSDSSGCSSSAVPAGTASVTFSYTGNVQSFIIPAGVTAINVVAVGATGGSNTGCPSGVTYMGGNGGCMMTSLTVTPQQTYYINVGGTGGSISNCGVGAGGFNGGIAGTGVGAGGGGSTDIRTAPSDLTTR